MTIAFQSFRDFPPGTITSLLCRAYSAIKHSDPQFWARENPTWEEYDRQVHDLPETVGSCGFVSVFDRTPVGMASWDPRRFPLGLIGHNCVLPSHQGKGYGQAQLREVLRRLGQQGFQKVRAQTGDQPFFAPARRMYQACGFQRVGKRTVRGFPTVGYEADLQDMVKERDK